MQKQDVRLDLISFKDGTQQRPLGESQTCPTFVFIAPEHLIPSPENKKVYRPVVFDDPAIQDLAQDIAERGVLEPLVVSVDGYILSGHRRRVAAIQAGLSFVPCRIENIRHDDPEFLKRLVAYNGQRIKNHAEQFREVLVKTNPDEAYRQLLKHRDEEAKVPTETIVVGSRKQRKKITRLKSEMAEAAERVIYELQEYWPLSVRQIHYQLLNDLPLRNIKHTDSRYGNDRRSYQDLCDLLARMRLNNTVPIDCIADETRSTTNWYVHANAQDFARRELGGFLKNYRRNIQQTQPLHIEIVAEKLTVQSIIKPVCGRFNIPYTIGRGYGSIPARWEILKRFKRSGKERLCLVVLGDLDPEGVNIGESLLQSIREDFGENDAQAVRAGLNPEHVQRFALSDNPAEAKKKSSRYRAFVERFGEEVYGLEALTPEKLQEILTETIDSIIDIDAFNAELDAEKQDAVYLQAVRQEIKNYCLFLLEASNDSESSEGLH